MNIFLVLLLVPFVFVWQKIAAFFLTSMINYVERGMKEVQAGVDISTRPKLEEEIKNFELIKEKKKYLSLLTSIIGCFELVFFGCTVASLYFLDGAPETLFGKIQVFILVISGWFVIKVVGNYQQWSGAVFGRATFYVFLIGSFINILGAVAVGLLIISILNLK